MSDFVLRFRSAWQHALPGGKGQRVRWYYTDLVYPGDFPRDVFRSEVVDTDFVRGWTLTLSRPFTRGPVAAVDAQLARGMNMPTDAYFLSFDPSEFVLATGERHTPRTNDRSHGHNLNGWIQPREGRVFLRDKLLARAGLDVVILLNERVLPFARRHPPFVRGRAPR